VCFFFFNKHFKMINRLFFLPFLFKASFFIKNIISQSDIWNNTNWNSNYIIVLSDYNTSPSVRILIFILFGLCNKHIIIISRRLYLNMFTNPLNIVYRYNIDSLNWTWRSWYLHCSNIVDTYLNYIFHEFI